MVRTSSLNCTKEQFYNRCVELGLQQKCRSSIWYSRLDWLLAEPSICFLQRNSRRRIDNLPLELTLRRNFPRRTVVEQFTQLLSAKQKEFLRKRFKKFQRSSFMACQCVWPTKALSPKNFERFHSLSCITFVKDEKTCMNLPLQKNCPNLSLLSIALRILASNGKTANNALS